MEKGLRIHIGSIPSTLFPGTITSLELFLVDSHNNVAPSTAGCTVLMDSQKENFLVSLVYENGTPVANPMSAFVGLVTRVE